MNTFPKQSRALFLIPYGILEKANARSALSLVRLMVLFPCFLICVPILGLYERAESLNGDALADEFGFQHPLYVIGITEKRELDDSWSKTSPEITGCFVKFGDSYGFFNPIDCKSMLDKKAHEVTENSTKGGVIDAIQNSFHDPSSMFALGGICPYQQLAPQPYSMRAVRRC